MRSSLFISTFFVFTTSLFAQWPDGAVMPPSIYLDEFIVAPSLAFQMGDEDLDEIAQQMAAHEAANRHMVSSHYALDFPIIKQSNSQQLNDGSFVYRSYIDLVGVEGMSLVFDAQQLPSEAEIFVVGFASKPYWNGPFTQEQAKEGVIRISDIPFPTVAVDVYSPEQLADDALTLLSLERIYRGTTYAESTYDKVGGSQPCEIDVNCPEGNDWEEQKDAVVRLNFTIDGQGFLCSGVLMNNTAEDGRGYILSANHCFESPQGEANYNSLQVRWNYERTGCNNGFAPTNHIMTGVVKRAESNDGGGASGSDFTLLELLDEIPEEYTPFWAGWNANINASPSGVSIHHPAGDRKKISTYSEPLQSVFVGAPGSHWRVNWVATETDHGVTEGGSSGSPIFNQQGEVVGTLTGGSSFCDTPNEPDFYGKIGYHWTSNGLGDELTLMPWLDPSGEFILDYDGTYVPDNIDAVAELKENPDVKIYPNPSNDFLNVAASQYKKIQSLKVYASNGQLITTKKTNTPYIKLPITDLPSGLYSLQIEWENGSISQKNFLVKH